MGTRRDRVNALEEDRAQLTERVWKSKYALEDLHQENESLRARVARLESQLSAHGRIPSNAGIFEGTASQKLEKDVYQGTGVTLGQTPEASQSRLPSTPEVKGSRPTQDISPWLDSEKTPSGTQDVVLPDLELNTPNRPVGSRVELPAKQIRIRKTDSRNVERINIISQNVNPILYEGLHVEVELRDDHDKIVMAAAPLELVVTDPTRPRDSWVMLRRTFKAEEVAKIINSGQAGLSIPFNIAWKAGCPDNLKLQVHALMLTSDGRRLVDRKMVDLAEASFRKTVTSSPQAPYRTQWNPER